MHHRIRQRDFARGIPDRNVGVGADRDRTLARVQVVYFRRGGGGQFHELFQTETSLRHHRVEQQRQPHLDPRQSIGHLLEIRIGAGAQLAVFIETIGRVVRRDGLEIAERQCLPQRFLIGHRSRRRAAHPLGAFNAGFVEIFGGEKKILRAGFRKHLQPLAARVADHPGAFRGRDVKDHDRLIDQRRHADQAVECVGLGEAGMADRMIFRMGIAAGQKPLHHPGDDTVVLGMGTQHGAGLARRDQNIEQGFVVDLQPVVGHEDLDRAMPLLHQRRNVMGQRFHRRIGDDHMEGVIDHRALLGERVIVAHHPRQMHADMLGRKADDRGRAAESRRGGRAFKGVGVHDTRRRQLLDMGVAVDAAGQHQLVTCIDLAAAGRQITADGGDGFTGNADIGLENVGCGRHAAAADHEVIEGFGHQILRKWQRPSRQSRIRNFCKLC